MVSLKTVQRKVDAVYLSSIFSLLCLCSHPHGLQRFDLLVEAAVDVVGIEQRVSSNLAQQIAGKVADIVFAEVPLPQHATGNHRLRVFMAALAEVPAEVLAVAEALYVV